jgi:hypothetical protein
VSIHAIDVSTHALTFAQSVPAQRPSSPDQTGALTMFEHTDHFIAGRWVDAKGGETIDVISPSTEQLVGRSKNGTMPSKFSTTSREGLESFLELRSVTLPPITSPPVTRTDAPDGNHPGGIPCPSASSPP